MSSFSFDKGAFDRAMAGVLARAEDHVRGRVDDLQRLVDELGVSHRGRPLDEVKAALQDGWHRVTGDGQITDPELTTWSTAIHDGQPLRIEYGGMRS